MNLSLLALLSFVASSLAHNWMVSPSRVPLAATTFPCLGRRSNLPHIQVAVGQKFQMEWATGHDRNVYFALLKSSDAAYLNQHSTRSTGPLEVYINEAPAQLLDHTQTPMICANCKYHRTRRAWNATHSLGGTVASHYAAPGPITSGPFYRPRPVEFGSANMQYAYVSSINDRYVSYNSVKFPWLKAVWRYEIQEGDPGEFDFAEFLVPPAEGPGDYIIHYLWSGYYDCIDINVIDTTVAGPILPYPYGKLPNGSALGINRVDHCIFDQPDVYVSFPRPVYGGLLEEAVASCTRNCLDTFNSAGCTGVSVFPVSIISRAWGPHWNTANNTLSQLYNWAWGINQHMFDSSFGFLSGYYGFPHDRIYNNGTYDFFSGIWKIYGRRGSNPWTHIAYNQTTLNTLRSWFEGGNGESDPWTCVYVSARTPTSTVDKYTVVDDPLDPVWYSTCYEVVERREFIGYAATGTSERTIPTSYFASTKSGCISCQDRANWAEENYLPKWNIQDKCVKCEGPGVVPAVPFAALFPKVRSQVSAISFDETAANADNATCTGRPPRFTTWLSYCMIPHLWTHPLLGNGVADTNTYVWGGFGNYSDNSSRVGWQSSLVEWPAQAIGYCAKLISKSGATCSTLADYRDSSTLTSVTNDHCRCLRANPCCAKFYRITSSTGDRHVFDTAATGTLDPTCTAATSLRSVNGTACCSVRVTGDCGAAGCATITGQGSNSRNGGTMCRGWQIPPTRCCSQYAPPCNLCT